MTSRNFFYRVLLGCLILLVFLVIVVPSCISPDVTTDELRKTRYWVMPAIRSTIQYALYETGHTNVLEYVNSIEGIESVPRMLKRETIRKIVNDAGVVIERFKLDGGESFYNEGIFFDAWRQPIDVMLTTNNNGKVGLNFHSRGKNKINGIEKGDDINMWNDINMLTPPL